MNSQHVFVQMQWKEIDEEDFTAALPFHLQMDDCEFFFPHYHHNQNQMPCFESEKSKEIEHSYHL